MSALVSSTSPQVGHEALMVVTAAIPFPSHPRFSLGVQGFGSDRRLLDGTIRTATPEGLVRPGIRGIVRERGTRDIAYLIGKIERRGDAPTAGETEGEPAHPVAVAGSHPYGQTPVGPVA